MITTESRVCLLELRSMLVRIIGASWKSRRTLCGTPSTHRPAELVSVASPIQVLGYEHEDPTPSAP